MNTKHADLTDRKRFRFRFSTKVLLVLVLLFGTVLGPFAWRMNRARNQRNLVATIRLQGGSVMYERRRRGKYEFSYEDRRGLDEESQLRQLLGNDFFDDVVSVFMPDGDSPVLSRISTLKKIHALEVTDPTKFDPKCIYRLRDLEFLSLGPLLFDGPPQSHPSYQRQISFDVGAIAHLQDLKFLSLQHIEIRNLELLPKLVSLKAFVISHSDVSDLSATGKLENLSHLDISFTPITDLGPLSNCAKLELLALNGVQLTDLSPLIDLNTLRFLYLTPLPANPPEAERVRLRKALPQLKIIER